MSLDIVKHEEGKRQTAWIFDTFIIYDCANSALGNIDILMCCRVFFFSLVLAPDSGWFFGGYCSNIGPMCLLL